MAILLVFWVVFFPTVPWILQPPSHWMWLGGRMAGWITLGIMQAQPSLAGAWQNAKGIFSKIESTHKMKKGKINRMLKE